MESRTSRSWAAQSSRKPRREAIFSSSKSFSDRLGHGLWPGDLRTCVTISTVAICLLTGFIPALSRSCHKYISSCIKEVFNNRFPWAAIFSLWAPSVALAFHQFPCSVLPEARISFPRPDQRAVQHVRGGRHPQGLRAALPERLPRCVFLEEGVKSFRGSRHFVLRVRFARFAVDAVNRTALS
jgi:hypothetical protein